MRGTVITLSGSILLVLAQQSMAQKNATLEWYEGGNLARSTIAEWRKAPARDRLATSADFAAFIARKENKKISNMNELRPMAVNIERCITEAARDGAVDTRPVSELAAACVSLID